MRRRVVTTQVGGCDATNQHPSCHEEHRVWETRYSILHSSLSARRLSQDALDQPTNPTSGNQNETRLWKTKERLQTSSHQPASYRPSTVACTLTPLQAKEVKPQHSNFPACQRGQAQRSNFLASQRVKHYTLPPQNTREIKHCTLPP